MRLSLTKPTPGADNDNWGTDLNNDLQAIQDALNNTQLTRTAVQTGAYTAAPGDLVPVDTATPNANVTVTLPNAPAVGSRVCVKHIAVGTGKTVTIACAGSDVFNKTGGVTSATLTLLNQAVTVQYDTGGIWTVVADDLPLTGLSGAYQPLVVAAETFTYNGDGTVATEVIGGVTFTYAYNSDGTVHTITRSDSGLVRTFSYNGDGTVQAVA